MVGDAKREVQIGEAVAIVHSERTHGCSGYDAVILLREPEPEHALAEGIPLLDGKHELVNHATSCELLSSVAQSRTACQSAGPVHGVIGTDGLGRARGAALCAVAENPPIRTRAIQPLEAPGGRGAVRAAV